MMFLSTFRHLRDAGILGINGRNAEIIMAYNPRSLFPTVDNKMITKELAALHDIPTPGLYGTIRKHGDIRKIESIIHDKESFAVKPARGSGGSGILLVRENKENFFITRGNRVIKTADLLYHVADILSGIFTLEGQDDIAIIEALINPDPFLESITFQGVPDIRIVVYHGVPIMAMARLPTSASDGKANLHGGAIGAGIEIKTRRTITAVHKNTVVKVHPDTGNPVSGFQIPYWEKTLLMAARSLEMTGLGYIGADMLIDRDRGPLLLELNARPGLAIQIANRAGLLKRIEKVNNAPAEIFLNPQNRVEWARNNIS
jgi:alpha-L-glutamate ligase-like protein